ncbi:MAG: Holliday junction resolvase RuvX [Bacteroidetes bacterium]|nr:Holliday junction resolvase RuvX [Bacteroidota bacterium]
MGRILAFDYGMKRTGVAATDPLQMIASPLQTVDTAVLHLWLADYLQKEVVDALIVGMPSRLSGEATHATQPVIEFIEKLKAVYPHIPVYTIDERLTSREAKNSLILGGQRKSKRQDKKLLDSVSATLILQTYLQQIS